MVTKSLKTKTKEKIEDVKDIVLDLTETSKDLSLN